MSNETTDLQDLKDRAAHHAVLMDIRAILATSHGKSFIKYLFESLMVGEIPEIGMQEQFLREALGHMRAGASIYKIVAQANPEVAGAILAQIEKDKYVQADIDFARPSGR